MKNSYKNNKFKITAPTRNKNLNYLADHNLYHVLNIILTMSLKNMKL